MGLNDDFKHVRGNILMMQPLPTLSQAYRLILQEEKQRECNNSIPIGMDSTALAAQKYPNAQNTKFAGSKWSTPGGSNSGGFGISPSGKKSKFYCTKCQVWGHSLDRCFKVHGFPNDKGNRAIHCVQNEHNSSQNVSQDSSHVSLTQDQLTQLMSLLAHNNLDSGSTPSTGPDMASAFMAGKRFCFISTYLDHKWVIDSGATDHVTPNLALFTSYKAISSPIFVNLPNGFKAKIHHIGTVQLNSQLTLQNVLHVPEFHFNLLSVHKLVKQHSSCVIFTPTSCLLQVPSLKHLLALGKAHNGLYLVDHHFKSSHAPTSFASFTTKLQTEIWHCRLGHLPF